MKDISDFTAGEWIVRDGVKYFRPSFINDEWVCSDPAIHALLDEANRKIGELHALAVHMPHAELFIFMHVVKEALSSTCIDHQSVDFESVLLGLHEEGHSAERRYECINRVVRALLCACDEHDLSSQALMRMHARVCGREDDGAFRTTQEVIGGVGVDDALFVPPHYSDVPALMHDLEAFLANQSLTMPHLMRIAIAHYQFETIHPFSSANGLLGRLLIPVYLAKNNILAAPLLYVSDFFYKNKRIYFDNFARVQETHDLNQWLKFFLVAVRDTAHNAITTFVESATLRNTIEDTRFHVFGSRSAKAKKLLRFLCENPVISAAHVKETLSVSGPTAHRLIDDFVACGILRETTGLQRNRIFLFSEYINSFTKG